jgi:peptidyl-prolyl cis-trans isomerase D
MATLEKIRSKSALLFTIIIVALLAFILGDFLTSGRSFFSDPTTLAVVDGHKLNINEFSNRVEQIRAQRQQQGYNDNDIAPIQQQVLDQMVYETLINEEIDRLGIVVTDAELSAAMTGANALPQIVNQCRQYGFETPDNFYDAAFNPSKYGITAEGAQQLKAAWLELEKNTSETLRQQKLGNLFMGTLTANKLDAKAYYDDNATTSKIVYTKQELSTLKDDDFKVTDADVKAQYEKYHNMFRLEEPTRVVDYITVDITPSQADLAAASAEVEAAMTALRQQPATEGVSGNVNFDVKRVQSPKSRINPAAVKASIEGMSVDSVKIASFLNNTYTIVKLLGVDSQVDSINIDFAVVEGDMAARDSVLTKLNGGSKAKDLLAAGTLAASQDSMWISMLDPQIATMKDQLAAAATGSFVALDTVAGQQQYRLIRVRNRKAPVTTYDYAQVTYTVEPSTTTLRTLESALSKYAAEHNTAAKFAEGAEKANYNVFPAQVTPSSLALNNLPDTREGVNWAMEASKGEVSPVFRDERDTRLLVVALKDIYDGDFLPMSDPSLNKFLTEEARNEKKASKLIADYTGKGKTVLDYAALMHAPVDTTSVTFGSPRIQGFFNAESALAGRVAAAKAGTVSAPFKGSSSVMVFSVLNVENSGLPFDQSTASSAFDRQQGVDMLARNFPAILRGKAKVENRIQKFYRK